MKSLLPVFCLSGGVALGVIGSFVVRSPEQAADDGRELLARLGGNSVDVQSLDAYAIEGGNSNEVESLGREGFEELEAINSLLGSSYSDLDRAVKALLVFVDKTGAHPDDPQKLNSVLGITDEILGEKDTEEIQRLVELSYSHALESESSARHLFELGRMAFIHYFDEDAFYLLKEAADRGSAAAYMYLAALVEDDQAVACLERAIEGGFEPAREMLAQYEVEEQSYSAVSHQPPSSASGGPLDFDAFSRPTYIKAFHDRNFSDLPESKLYSFSYVISVLENLNSDSTLFMSMDPELRLLVSPDVLHAAKVRMAGDADVVREATNVGFESLFTPFLALAENRRRNSNHMGLMEGAQSDVTAMNQALLQTSSVRLELERQKGEYDARRLMLLYSTNKEGVVKIYEGMKAFIYSR